MRDVQPNRLSELREQSRLTQEEVGKLMDLAPSTVSKHEAGTRSLSQENIERYAAIYKVRTFEIFVNPNDLQQGSDDNERDESNAS